MFFDISPSMQSLYTLPLSIRIEHTLTSVAIGFSFIRWPSIFFWIRSVPTYLATLVFTELN